MFSESNDSSALRGSPESSVESEESGGSESGAESRSGSGSGESEEAAYKRSSIPSDDEDENLEDDEYDSVDSALESKDKSYDTPEDDQAGSTDQKRSTRGKVITDTMDDIAQAALGKKIEKKSDIIHSLPENSEDSSGEQESTVATGDDIKQRRGTTLKNLFTALADGQASSGGSGEETTVTENQKSDVAQNRNQVSVNSFPFADKIYIHCLRRKKLLRLGPPTFRYTDTCLTRSMVIDFQKMPCNRKRKFYLQPSIFTSFITIESETIFFLRTG